MSTPLLACEQVGVRYGGVRALSHVNLDVAAGQVLGLVGPNGAGKTTFIDAISGFVRCTGSIHFAGTDLTHTPAHRRARHGLARTWQAAQLFTDLDVVSNLRIASRRHRGSRGRPAATTDAAAEALDALGISELAGHAISDLTHGQRKLVGIARALAGQPRLLCLDEPAAGLDSAESQQLGTRLSALADSGLSLLLIDHDMDLVLGICDTVHVLDFGETIALGTPSEIRHDPRVRAAYLGTAASDTVL